MATGFPVKADYVTGDVLSAANMNDLAGTLNYLDPTAKGDLFPASSGTALTRLAVGANGTVLTADSAEATGMKWAAAGGGATGLTLVKAQTIGSAVSSVTVTDAFSATYDNYLITVSGGSGSVDETCRFTLGSTTSGYYMGGYYLPTTSATITGFNINNGANWSGSYYSTTTHSGHMHLQNPFLTKNTTFNSILIGASTSNYFANYTGYLNNTTSYTAFTLTPASGTLTGGTIRVYGYQNS